MAKKKEVKSRSRIQPKDADINFENSKLKIKNQIIDRKAKLLPIDLV